MLYKQLLSSILGLTKEAAYKALTQTPAALLKMENVLGKIAPGKWANLIVCSDELFEKNGVILENWTQGIQHVISTAVEITC